jgi:hypothetical protein
MRAFENALERFLLCNTPGKLDRLREGSDVLAAKEKEGFSTRSCEKAHHIPLRSSVGQSPGVQGDYWT